MLHSNLISNIIQVFIRCISLGYGFLEKVYENTLNLELQKSGLSIQSQHHIKVYYNETIVGNYFADLIVENRVIIELKAAEKICEVHELQLINYLRATELEVGLLLNFGKRPEFRRKIFTNDKRHNNNP